MDHPSTIPGRQIGPLQRGIPTANEAATEAIRIASRLSDTRAAFRELSNRLRIVNEGITGYAGPEKDKPAPDNNCIAGILNDLEVLAGECNRLAQAIEANLS